MAATLKFALSESERTFINEEGNEDKHASVFKYVFNLYKEFLQKGDEMCNLTELPVFLKSARIALPKIVNGL
jgi:hypothetical protein